MITTVEKVLFLRGIDLFSQISGEDLARIAQIASEGAFEKNELIFAQGDIGDSLYLVIEGKVKVHIEDKFIAELGERECFGEMAILDSEPRSASVTAVQDVILLIIERDAFFEIMHENILIAQGIIKVLIKRLRDANKK